jgi:hypothetical protein
MPANSGRIVHEHAARIVPETAATLYATALWACAPKYFITAACETKHAIAPAMNNAGTRQSSTWCRA